MDFLWGIPFPLVYQTLELSQGFIFTEFRGHNTYVVDVLILLIRSQSILPSQAFRGKTFSLDAFLAQRYSVSPSLREFNFQCDFAVNRVPACCLNP